MGFFIRPKGSNKDDVKDSKTKLKAESIGVVQAYEDEYFQTSGFDPTVTGLSGAFHHRDATRREAAPGDPLLTSGRSAGISSSATRGYKAAPAKRGSMPRKGR